MFGLLYFVTVLLIAVGGFQVLPKRWIARRELSDG